MGTTMILNVSKIQTASGNIWVLSGIAVKRTFAAGNVLFTTQFLGWSGSFKTRKEAWAFAWQALKFRLKYGAND